MEPRTKITYQKNIYDFIEPEILVLCPKCEKKASIKTGKFSTIIWKEENIKLVCGFCGYNKRLSEKPCEVFSTTTDRNCTTGRSFEVGIGRDPFFNSSLWLSTNCLDNLLWAYNYDHLDFLELHVGSKLRERNLLTSHHESLGSKLPKWMTSKKNRDIILKNIEMLRSKV